MTTMIIPFTNYEPEIFADFALIAGTRGNCTGMGFNFGIWMCKFCSYA